MQRENRETRGKARSSGESREAERRREISSEYDRYRAAYASRAREEEAPDLTRREERTSARENPHRTARREAEPRMSRDSRTARRETGSRPSRAGARTGPHDPFRQPPGCFGTGRAQCVVPPSE